MKTKDPKKRIAVCLRNSKETSVPKVMSVRGSLVEPAVREKTRGKITWGHIDYWKYTGFNLD